MTQSAKAVGLEVSEYTLLFLFFGSLIQLVAAAIVCDDSKSCKDYNAYAVAVGAVSTFFTLFQGIANFFSFGFAEKMQTWLSFFLFLWWIPGATIPTFKTPFLVAGNGYFASWMSFFFAVYFFYQYGYDAVAAKIPKRGARVSNSGDAAAAKA